MRRFTPPHAVLLFFSFFVTTLGKSQEVDPLLYGYTKVYVQENKTREEIHSLVKQWINETIDTSENGDPFIEQNKIVVKREFDLNPLILKTFQNTTTKYSINGVITFYIKEGKVKVDLAIDDLYSFDGKKADPKSTLELLNSSVDNEFIKVLLSKGFMNVKQYGGFISSLKTGDKKAKQAEKYVAKELKKGVYLKRMQKLSEELNREVNSVYTSIEELFSQDQEVDF